MVNPEDEREAFWKAVGVVDDRVSELTGRFEERESMTLEMIQRAVREAMPKTLVSEGEHEFLRMLMAREERRAKFQQKIIDSSVVWAVPALLGGSLWVLWKLVASWLSAHGLWKD